MLIYEALKKDHAKVKSLLSELISLTDRETDRRAVLIEAIRNELIPHSRAEESVFYNSLRLIDSTKKLAMHGYKEHMEAEGLLRALQVMDKIDMSWKATAMKLKEALEHHIEEEESTLFAAGQQLFTDQEARMMADTFEHMKPEIREEGLMGTTVDMLVNLMPQRFSDTFRSSVNPH